MRSWRRTLLPALSICVSVPAFAHGEQALVFPLSFALLFILRAVTPSDSFATHLLENGYDIRTCPDDDDLPCTC